MKKLVVFISIWLSLPVQVGAWGLMIGAGDGTSLLFKYLGQQQVVQPVCIQTYAQGEYLPGLPVDSKVTPAQLVSSLEGGINYWFTKSREFLQKSGRQEEFVDVLAVLPQHVNVQLEEDCSKPHTLRLVYAPREWYINVIQTVDGIPIEVRHKAHYTVPRVRVSTEKAWTETARSGASVTLFERLDLINLAQTLTHEAGHLLGLADQYGFASYLMPGENTSSYFASYRVSGKNTQKLNQSLKMKKMASIMGAPRFHAQALQTMWPDDVDALVNAVDFVQVYHKGMLSPRVVNGWKSFSLADQRVGYSFAAPFQYTTQNEVPQELLTHVTSYSSKLGGLGIENLALLKHWYQDTKAPVAYTQVRVQDLRQWQESTLAQLAVTAQLNLAPAKGIQLVSSSAEFKYASLPDLIPLQLPTRLGKSQHLTVVHQAQQKDPDCTFYLIVTDKEMNWFKDTYGSVLARAHKKQTTHKKLTRKETRITHWYEQMKENQRKTSKCQIPS